MQETAKPRVVIETNLGPFTLELEPEKAPKTVENFLAYVDAEFYDGTIFHRVIENFMIQGGGFDERMSQKPAGDPIENEADNGLSNKRGTIAMARMSDPHSATAQFFINTTGTNSFLDHAGKSPQGWGYCVFGQVVEGMETIDKIRQVETGRHGPHQDVPAEPVVIQSARRVEQ